MQIIRKTFADQSVLLDLEARDLSTIFKEAVGLLVGKGVVPKDRAADVEAALLERERRVSTAIGHAVAVPHAYLDAVSEPTVVFVRLKHPVNLGAPDGIPTQFIYFLLGPEEATSHHLDTLASIARLMADDEFRYDAREARNCEQLVEAQDRFHARTSPDRVLQSPKESVVPEGLRWTGKLMGGIREDIARRFPHYVDDWRQGLHLKCLGSTLFLFFACAAPTVIFGGVMAKNTGGMIGPVEMILSTAIGGIVYALLSGQPLIILGGTGPLLVIITILYDLCESNGVDFLQAYAWVGLWSGLFTVLLAITDASCLIRFFTRFTDEIFAALISMIFIFEAISNLVAVFRGVPEGGSYESALLALLLALGTFYIAMSLSAFRRSSYLLPWMREFLADFGPTLAMAAMAAVALWMSQVEIDTLPVPEQFGTTSGRPWMVDIASAPTWLKWGAAGPALVFAVLIYLDQNITARLVNSPDHKLQKGSGYHMDLAIIGGLVAFCSLFALPWLVAATVRSLNHVRSLASMDEVVEPNGSTHERIVHVRETRLTGFMIHVLLGVSLLALPYLGMVPMAVLYGLFLFMGIVSMSGNQFFERLSLWFKDPDLYPVTHYIRRAPIWTIHTFTGIQLACLLVLWIVKTHNLPEIAILFPLFVALLVPVRMAAGIWFKQEHLEALDAEEEPEDEETHWSG